MQNLYEDLTQLLAQDERLVTEDGALLKNRIGELGLKLDPDLLRLLLSHDRIKHHFFTEVDGVLVFDKHKFLDFVNNKQSNLPEVEVVCKTAPPTGSGLAVEVPVGGGGAVADRARRGDSNPRCRPGVGVSPKRSRAAGGQVVLDQGDGRTGIGRGAAAVADPVAADVVDGAVQGDEVAGAREGDGGVGHGACPFYSM